MISACTFFGFTVLVYGYLTFYRWRLQKPPTLDTPDKRRKHIMRAFVPLAIHYIAFGSLGASLINLIIFRGYPSVFQVLSDLELSVMGVPADDLTFLGAACVIIGIYHAMLTFYAVRQPEYGFSLTGMIMLWGVSGFMLSHASSAMDVITWTTLGFCGICFSLFNLFRISQVAFVNKKSPAVVIIGAHLSLVVPLLAIWALLMFQSPVFRVEYNYDWARWLPLLVYNGSSLIAMVVAAVVIIFAMPLRQPRLPENWGLLIGDMESELDKARADLAAVGLQQYMKAGEDML